MKKNLANKTLAMLLAVLLAALCVFAGGRTTVNAEEAAGPHNYLTAKWDTSEFPGNLTETEEDGVKVTTYTPSAAQPWFSASMSVLDDVKTLAKDKDFVEVVFCMEISGEFSGAGGGEANCGVLLRAVSPRNNSISFAGTADWDGEGTSWEELYFLYSDGEPLFFVSEPNVMANLEPQVIEIKEGEWTYFESEPIFVASAALTDELFAEWKLCAHQITWESGLTSLKFRNEGIYIKEDLEPTAAPTAEPTEPPTEAPATKEPEVTAAPAQATDEPVKPGETTAKPADEKKGGLGTGALIGIIAGGVVVVAAVVAGVVAASKKKKK